MMAGWLTLFLLTLIPAALAVEPDATIIGDDKIRIPVSRFEAELAKAPAEAQAVLLQDSKRTREVLSNLYLQQLLAAEAAAEGLDRDPALLAELENYRLHLLAKARLKQLRQAPVPDMTPAAREYYRTHPEEFRTLPEADVSHILIRPSSKRSKDEAKKLAGELLERIRRGEDFAALARQYSDDRSAQKNGGRLGWIRSDKLIPTFSRKVFEMQPGDTGVVKSTYGYHVVKVWDLRPAQLKPFDEVKDQLVDRLEKDYRSDRVKAYLDKLRQRTLKLNKPVLDAFIEEKLAELAPQAKKPEPKPVEKLAEPVQ